MTKPRLSMKLLWKFYAEDYSGNNLVSDFLKQLEAYMKSPTVK